MGFVLCTPKPTKLELELELILSQMAQKPSPQSTKPLATTF